MISDDLAAKMAERGPDGLDMANDLEYLVGLVGHEALGSDEFESDDERVRWAVAHWCQEVGYLPDIREYETGQIVPSGEVPPNDERRLNELPPSRRVDGGNP
jgi:hypothetical protein